MATNQGCKGLVPSNVLDHKYLFYYLTSIVNLLNELGTGTTFAELSGGRLKEVPLPMPRLAEQQRIVAILDEAFEGIDTAVANTEKNLANARELFDSYLNSIFNFAREHARLSDLATDITDGDHSPPPKALSGVPFITISNIIKSSRKIDFGDTFFVPREYFDALRPNKRPRIGDVLYTVTGATLGIPVLVETDTPFCFQRHIGLIRPKPEVDSVWLSYALSSHRVFSQATVGSTGAAQKTVSLSVLRNITLPRIRTSEQRAIARQLGELNAQVQKLEILFRYKIAAIRELKQAILNKAFAGELTAHPEKALPEAAE
jgi:type I restriction enzyme S subunit